MYRATWLRITFIAIDLALAAAVALAAWGVFLTDAAAQPWAGPSVATTDREALRERTADRLVTRARGDYDVIENTLGVPPEPDEEPVPPPERVPPPDVRDRLEVIAVARGRRTTSCFVRRLSDRVQRQLSPGDEIEGFRLEGIDLASAEPERYRVRFVQTDIGSRQEVPFPAP